MASERDSRTAWLEKQFRPSVPDAVWAAVLVRLREGLSLTQIEDIPGYPSRAGIRRHAKLHPDFRSAMDEAIRANGREAAGRALPEWVWSTVLQAARASRCTSIYALAELEGMPDKSTLLRRYRRDRAFREELGDILARHREKNRAIIPPRKKAPNPVVLRPPKPILRDAHIWAAIIAKVEEGLLFPSIAAIEGFPSVRAITSRMERKPAFRARVEAARQRRAVHLRREIVRRRRAGESITDIATSAGMPERATIHHWIADDPQFAAEMDQARRDAKAAKARARAKLKGPSPYTQAQWDEVIARLAEGLSIKQVGLLKGYPTRDTIIGKRASDPVFRRRTEPYVARNEPYSDAVWTDVLQRLRSGSSPLQIAELIGMPAARHIRERIARDPVYRRAAQPMREARLHNWEMVKFHLRQGLTPAEVSAMPGMPHRRTFHDRRKKDPALAALMKQADAARVILPVATVLSAPAIRVPKVSSISHEAVLAAVERAVPRGLPHEDRQDVVSAMVLAVFEGELDPADIADRAKEFVSAQRREFDDFKLISTDTPVGSDGWTLGQSLGL